MEKITRLPNGLRIIAHQMKYRKSASVGIFIAVGGRDEPRSLSGISHFIEHLVFKGTRQYSNEEIKQGIEGRGGHLNAYTDEEATCYYAKVLGEHIGETLHILADMCLAPTFDPKEFDQERQVILEEINMYRDLPAHHIVDMMNELVWPGQALGRNLMGDPRSLMGLNPKKLHHFRRRYYSARNIVIAAAGHFDHAKFLNACQRIFGHLPKSSQKCFVKGRHRKRGPYLAFHRKKSDQAHMFLAMPTISRFHKNRYALEILNIILGANMSSRLFQILREEEGLAYDVKSGYTKFDDTGLFSIYTAVDKKNICKTLRLTIAELDKLKIDPPSPRELQQAKNYYLGSLRLSLESTMNVMMWLGENTLARNKTRSVCAIEKDIQKVRGHDIQGLAKNFFQTKHYHLCLISDRIPLKNIEHTLKEECR